MVHGERFDKITFTLEGNGGPQVFGFVTRLVETLIKVRTTRRVYLELDDGTKLAATMLQVNHSGMALMANLTSASDTADGLTQAAPRTFRDLKECRRLLAEQPSEAAIEFIMG